MTAATFAQSITQLKAVVDLLDETEKYGASAGTNFTSLLATLDAAALYDYGDRVRDAARAMRATLAATLTTSAVQAILSPALDDVAAAINAPERGDVPAILFRLREYMLAQTPDETLNSREFTHGSQTSVGSPVGNGIINRLTVDEDGYPLEGSHSETKTFEIVADQGQVDKHEEEFEVRGAKPEPSILKLVGSGILRTLKAISARNSEEVLVNPDFTQFSGTAPTASTPTAFTTVNDLTGWVADSITGLSMQVDRVYRSLVSTASANRMALNIAGNRTLTQTIETQRRARLETGAPYYVQLAVYRKDTATGTLTIHWGSQSQAFTIGSLNNNAWNICRLDLDKDLFYKNFKQDTMTVKIVVASLATGTVDVQNWTCGRMTFIDGLWYAAVGGSTPWMRADKYTFADTQNATRGVLSYWLTLRTGIRFSLPSVTGGTETIGDP
ncbi:MAG TPA: hypothetical protein VEA38_12115 [Terriglobales bacterium]|nr:hypothetical protein [Terriglobales bacterium]